MIYHLPECHRNRRINLSGVIFVIFSRFVSKNIIRCLISIWDSVFSLFSTVGAALPPAAAALSAVVAAACSRLSQLPGPPCSARLDALSS